MNYSQLKEYNSELQMEIDRVSYEAADYVKLSYIQSVSEANVFWLKSVSPIILKPCVVDFLFDNKERFKRKLKVGELLQYDFIIAHNNPQSFDEFIQLVKN